MDDLPEKRTGRNNDADQKDGYVKISKGELDQLRGDLAILQNRLKNQVSDQGAPGQRKEGGASNDDFGVLRKLFKFFFESFETK